jgi:predicted CXXCH cytochrome family protein
MSNMTGKILVSGLLLMAGVSTGLALAFESNPVKSLPFAAKEPLIVGDSLKAAKYVGSQICAGCHKDDHAEWKQTWHANMHRVLRPGIVIADFYSKEITYKDVEIETPDKKKMKISPIVRLNREGDSFSFTLVDKDNSANNQTYPIAYVFGGNWNQHFEAQVGSVYYPTPMRWIVEDDQWTTKPFNDLWWVADGTPDGRPKRPEEMPKTKTGDATCDGCHTTGFSIAKSKENGNWVGQKVELGIGCEACHGPGGIHATSKQKIDIVNPALLNAVQQDQLCGQCHSRINNKQEKELFFPLEFKPGNTDLSQRVKFWTYSANRKNFWPNGYASKNRQQYHDVQFSGHNKAGVTCITCHDTHSGRKGYAQVRGDKNTLCVQCHKASSEFYSGSAMDKAAVGCTDCHMARIANRSDATQKSKDHWDVNSHNFAVVLPRMAEKLKMKSSCDACHIGADRAAKGAFVDQRQADIKTKIAEVEKAIASSGKGKAAQEARNLLAVIKNDRSSGAHNPLKAMSLLANALKSLAKQ